MRETAMRDIPAGDLAQELAHRRRGAVARRPHGTGLEYGLIAAALAVAIVTVVAGLGARYGERASAAPAIEQTVR